MAWTRVDWIREMLRVAVALKIVLCNMHVAKYILYDVARKIDSFSIPGKVDAVLRKKSLLQVVRVTPPLGRVPSIYCVFCILFCASRNGQDKCGFLILRLYLIIQTYLCVVYNYARKSDLSKCWNRKN